MLHERFEGIALRDRDVVAADAVAIPELVHPDELRDRGLKSGRIALERDPRGVRRQRGVLRHDC